ncbi:putative protein C10orf92, partial [Ophiophagus hannah]
MKYDATDEITFTYIQINIVDPYNDGREDEVENPANNFRGILEKFEPFTIHWEGIMGDTHFPSYTEWEYILNNCSMLFFSAMARFLAHVALDKLVAMNIPADFPLYFSKRKKKSLFANLWTCKNTEQGREKEIKAEVFTWTLNSFLFAQAHLCYFLPKDVLPFFDVPECQLIILSGRVHSKPSLIRLRNQDEGRSSLRLSLEKTTKTAIILSLIGVRSVIINQWFTTLEENTMRLDSLCESK